MSPKSNYTSFIAAAVLAFCIAVVAPLSFAASAMIRVGYPQPSGAMLPLWLVSEAKLDQKYGVPVQNIFISGAARMNQSMVAGDIDIASIGGAVVNTGFGGRRSGSGRGRSADVRVFSLCPAGGQRRRKPAWETSRHHEQRRIIGARSHCAAAASQSRAGERREVYLSWRRSRGARGDRSRDRFRRRLIVADDFGGAPIGTEGASEHCVAESALYL